MTEKECLEAIIKGWGELAEDPRLDKSQTSLGGYRSNCPCCEYVGEMGHFFDLDCYKYCPMRAAWPGGCLIYSPKSIFKEWLTTTGYDRCFFAALIVEWAEYLSNRLENK